MNGEKVKVSITFKQAEKRYCVKSSHPLPPSNAIAGFLPKAKQQMGRNYCRDYGFPGVVGMTAPTITPKEWSEAIAKATLFALDQANGADVELVNASEGGYLSIGNFVFKLSVADYVMGGQRALPVLRKRVMDAARAEGEKAIEAMQKKGADLYDVAEKKYLAKMNEVEKLQQQVNAMNRGLRVTLPPWFANSELLFRNYSGRSYIGAWIGVVLRTFVYTAPDGAKYYWAGAPGPTAHMILWFPYTATGEWNPEQLQTSECTPHTSTGGSCLKLGTTPKLLSADAVFDAAQHVSEVLQEVNLNSPYCSYGQWGACKAFTPEKLRATFVEWDKTGGARLGPLCDKVKATADASTPLVPTGSAAGATVFGVAAEFNTEDN